MLYVDIPTISEFMKLHRTRADACVSIYVKTTPLTQFADAGRIELGNLAKEARQQLEKNGLDKRRLALLVEHFDDLADDEEFWRLQANSLAVLATPDDLRTFRLANHLMPSVQVSDRFHLSPLLRAITFPHSAYVLAVSENAVRLVEMSSDLPPTVVKVEGMPRDAAGAVKRATINDRSPRGRLHGSEGQNVLLRQYVRKVDAALRPLLAGHETPLILAAPERLASLFRSVNSYPHLLERHVEDSPDRWSEAELAEAARPLLDASYREEIDRLKALYGTRAGQRRATAELSDAARAATFGAIEALLVDIDSVVPGTLDGETGAVKLAGKQSARSYDLIDEIAGRALASGARVLGVRKDDLPGGGELAAILRYPF